MLHLRQHDYVPGPFGREKRLVAEADVNRPVGP